MTNPEEPTSEKQRESPPPTMQTPTAPAATVDVESQATETGQGVSGILTRWKREDLLKRGSLALRGLALLFSLLSFIIMATNTHGDWQNFDRYDEYKYLLAIAILSTLYTGGQSLRQIHELSTAKLVLQQRTLALIDFFGDQIMAYLLISAASAAIPLTNSFRRGSDNIFTDSSASSISMSVFAFMCLAVSAIMCGYKIMAYLLISAASAAIPLTNNFRRGSDNIFTDSSASSISMAVFAFMCLAVSAIMCGYKLSTQSYI